MLAACGNDKYVDKIDKAVKMQDQKQEQMAKNDTGDMVKHIYHYHMQLALIYRYLT
jgi:hypothetical protein